MNQKTLSVGDLAARLLWSRKSGRVTRVFRRSAYVKCGEEFLLLLWDSLRSPLTVNIEGGDATRGIRVGEICKLSREGVTLDSRTIEVEGAEVFRSALLDRREVILPGGDALTKGVTMLRSLYDVSASGPTLNKDSALRAFAETILVPLATGESAGMFLTASYLPLVGRGGGFTPAGDDFLGGLLATFNFISRCRKSGQVHITRALLRGRTVQESANVLFYSTRGYVDEGMERLVLSSLDGGPSFSDELMEVAHRGHTSGIDMSLGVLLCEAAISDADGEGGVLESCLDALWHP